MAKKAARPRDSNQLAKSIVDMATGQGRGAVEHLPLKDQQSKKTPSKKNKK